MINRLVETDNPGTLGTFSTSMHLMWAQIADLFVCRINQALSCDRIVWRPISQLHTSKATGINTWYLIMWIEKKKQIEAVN